MSLNEYVHSFYFVLNCNSYFCVIKKTSKRKAELRILSHQNEVQLAYLTYHVNYKFHIRKTVLVSYLLSRPPKRTEWDSIDLLLSSWRGT